MANTIRALRPDEITAIIRAHPAPFAAMANSGGSLDEMSAAATSHLFANPEILNSVAAAGMGITVEAAAKLGMLKWLAVGDIIRRTCEDIGTAGLSTLLLEELAPLSSALAVSQ